MKAGVGGCGGHFSERVLRLALDLGTQGLPVSPLALSRPQFPCLRSSMLGSGAVLQKPGPWQLEELLSRGLGAGEAPAGALAWTGRGKRDRQDRPSWEPTTSC